MTMPWKEVGFVSVDSGLIMIGDPCYVLPDDGSRRNYTAKDWQAFCTAIGDTKTSEPFGAGVATTIHSGCGDGSYPVQVKEDPKTGRIKEVRVKFF